MMSKYHTSSCHAWMCVVVHVNVRSTEQDLSAKMHTCNLSIYSIEKENQTIHFFSWIRLLVTISQPPRNRSARPHNFFSIPFNFSSSLFKMCFPQDKRFN